MLVVVGIVVLKADSQSGRRVGKEGGSSRFRLPRRHRRTQQKARSVTMYRVTDRLHAEHSVVVSCHDIAHTVSTWLAELGAHTALVDDFARAICAGDWPTAYAIGDRLSVDVFVAA